MRRINSVDWGFNLYILVSLYENEIFFRINKIDIKLKMYKK